MFPLQDSIPHRSPPVATWILIGLNALAFWFELRLGPEALEALIYRAGVVPARYAYPGWAEAAGLDPRAWWPFLTCMFLHGGWAHFLGNMWTLWIFGDNVEDRMGRLRFLVFYLLCGLAASVVHVALNAESTVPVIGASGAISGVMGAYYLLFPHSRIILMVPVLIFPFFFDVPAVVYLAFWFALQLFSGSLSLLQDPAAGGVAFWAHVGGFAAGMLLLPFFLLGRRPWRPLMPDEGCLECSWHRRPFGPSRTHSRPRHG